MPVSISPLLIEAWKPTDGFLVASLEHFQREAETVARATAWPKARNLGDIEVTRVGELRSVTMCVKAWPHTDQPPHPRWFLFWNLASRGHVLHSRDVTKSPGDRPFWNIGQNPDPKPDQSVPMMVGDIVILDARREHWLVGPTSGERWSRWYLAANFDVTKRPNRASAEAAVSRKVRAAMSK